LWLEKEKGTIEQINVTPVSRLEFTLSKLIPYWIIGLVVLTEGILTVGLVYGLWPVGSTGAIYLAAILFTFAMSGFAVTIANGSDTMQQSIFVLFFFVMIFMLMSGMLTPLGSMPGGHSGLPLFSRPVTSLLFCALSILKEQR
jgi:ABC-2 type transport system permease protein